MLHINQIEKRYSNGRGLGPVSLTITKGEIVGVIGPNGSGKTTLFSILAGTIMPQNGSITTISRNGKKYTDTRIPSHLTGFVPEVSFILDTFTPTEALQFDAAMRHIDITDEKIIEHLKSFNAHMFADAPIKTLSQGQAKRIELARAFLGSPTILVLDEPLNGLDIQSVIHLRSKVLEAKKHGTIVLISSHILTFIDEVADRIIFLKDGAFSGEFSPHDTKAETAYTQLFINTPHD